MKLRRIKQSKKGSVQDLLYIGITLFVFALVILICFRISTSLNTEFQASDQIDSKGKAAHQQITNMYPGIIDNSFINAIFKSLWMFSITFAASAVFILFAL